MNVIVGVSLPVSMRGLFRKLKLVKCLGIDWIELVFARYVDVCTNFLNDLKKVLSKLKLCTSIHAPYSINFCSEKLIVQERSLELVKRCLDIAHLLESKCVVIHAAYYMSYGPTLCYNLVKKHVQELVKYVESRGYECKIAIETMGRKSQFGTLDEVLRLCRDVNTKYIIPCIDWAHVYIRNGGYINYEHVLSRLLDSINTDHIHTHFTCVHDLEDEHEPLDSNNPPFRELVLTLRKFKDRINNIVIVCETPLQEKDAVKMKKIISELL